MNFFFRFFLGSNKVMQVSLGRSAADEITPGIHKVSKVSTLFHGDNNYYCSVFPINLHCYASCLLPFVILFFFHFFPSFYVEIVGFVLLICQKKRLKGERPIPDHCCLVKLIIGHRVGFFNSVILGCSRCSYIYIFFFLCPFILHALYLIDYISQLIEFTACVGVSCYPWSYLYVI